MTIIQVIFWVESIMFYLYDFCMPIIFLLSDEASLKTYLNY